MPGLIPLHRLVGNSLLYNRPRLHGRKGNWSILNILGTLGVLMMRKVWRMLKIPGMLKVLNVLGTWLGTMKR